MNKNIPLIVAGTVFALVALAHLYRIMYVPEITVDGTAVPLTMNYIGLVISGLLSVWMFAAVWCKCGSKKE